MKCRNCGCEIPVNVRYCDNCGERVVVKNKKIKIKKDKKPSKWATMSRREKIGKMILFVYLIAFCSFVFFVNHIAKNNETEEEAIARLPMRVTSKQYSELRTGMTYSEVAELFEGEGLRVQKTSSELKYAWPGAYLEGIVEAFRSDYTKTPVVYVYFDRMSDTVLRFEEINVVNGGEMNKLMERDIKTDIEENELKSIEKGISYEEAVRILGNEGKLIDSRSDNVSPQTKTYMWEYPSDYGFDEVYRAWVMTFENDSYVG